MTSRNGGRITWSAGNNSSYLSGEREAKTVRGAVIAGRRYVNGELMGEGTLVIYSDGVPVRLDRKDIFTKGRWESCAI